MLQPSPAPSSSAASLPRRTAAAPSATAAVLKRIGWVVMFALAAGVLVREYPSLTLNWDFQQQRLVYAAHAVGITTHIAGSIIALIVGPLQFVPQLRKKRYLAIHRWLGRTYLIGVLFGSTAGFYMAWLSHGGLPTHLAFASLAVWWFATGLMAYRHIRARQIEAHRRWMIRNYATTFAAVTLRLWLLLLLFPLNMPFTEAYITVSWICWVWNIAVAEWLISRLPGAQRISDRPAARPATVRPQAAVS
jgi:uncharacterized membrane protein